MKTLEMKLTSVEPENRTDDNSQDQHGFTLIEVLAVVVILAIIMSIFAKGIFSKAEAAKAQANVAKMESLRSNLSMYRLQFNSFPSSLEDLVRPSSEAKKSGVVFTPFVNAEELKDVWGNPYIYKAEGNNRSYTLTSLGSDGTPGGEGDKQDVTIRPN